MRSIRWLFAENESATQNFWSTLRIILFVLKCLKPPWLKQIFKNYFKLYPRNFFSKISLFFSKIFLLFPQFSFKFFRNFLNIYLHLKFFSRSSLKIIVNLQKCLPVFLAVLDNSNVKSIRSISQKSKFYRKAVSRFLYTMCNQYGIFLYFFMLLFYLLMRLLFTLSQNPLLNSWIDSQKILYLIPD